MAIKKKVLTMVKNKYVLYRTYFETTTIRQVLGILKRESLDFKIIDKSNPMNFRIPSSTFIEVDVMVIEEEFEKVDALLKEF